MDSIIQVIDGRQKKLSLDQINDEIVEEINQFAIEKYGNFDVTLYQ